MAAPEDNHGRSHAAHTEYASQMASVLTRLDNIDDAVRDLGRHVREQNGRVGKIETRQAAYDAMVVTGVREHQGVDGRMETMGERITELETFRHEAAGAGKATLGMIRDGAMIFTFLMAAWQMYESRAEHQAPAPVVQHQAK